MARRPFGSAVRRLAGAGAVALGCLALANCTTDSKLSNRKDPRYGVAASPRVIEPGQPVPKGGGTYRVGKPYEVAGRTYVPEENRRYRAEGTASWYGEDFHGRLTANGEIYDMEAISGAHATMPMPSYARVTNLQNGRSLIVRVNDRGPYHSGRVIDLSSKAAELLEFRNRGTARVRVEYVGSAPLEGTDDRQLLATLREGSPAPAPSLVRVAAARPFVPQLSEAEPLVRRGTVQPPERRLDLVERSADRSERPFEYRNRPSALEDEPLVRRGTAPQPDSRVDAAERAHPTYARQIDARAYPSGLPEEEPLVRKGSASLRPYRTDLVERAQPTDQRPFVTSDRPAPVAATSDWRSGPNPVSRAELLPPRGAGAMTASQQPAREAPAAAYASPRLHGSADITSGRGLY